MRALVEGYTKSNLGDDLFFNIMANRYPETNFVFNSNQKSKALDSLNNVVVKHFHARQLINSIKNFDCFIVIGGSLFQQSKKQSWLRGWLSLFVKIMLFKIYHKKVIIIGFNFGPYYTKSFYMFYRFLFNFVDYLSVRDKATLELFKDNKNIHLFPDIVFSLPNDIIRKKNKTIAISVMDFGPNKSFQQEYENFLVAVINGIKPELKITLYGFQQSSTINDQLIIDRISSRINRKNMSCICYNGGNTKEFLRSYYANFFALTSRFHSLVLSLKARQQVISIDYNIKVKSLLSTLKIKNTDVKMVDFTNQKIVMQVINQINNATLQDNDYLNEVEFNNIVDDASNHFNYLDSLLGIKNEENNI